MFTAIQKILPRAINKLGVKREMEAALICEKYRKFAPRCIHAKALEYTFPKFYKGKTLTIGVENSAWAQVVMEHQAELIENINGSLGKKSLKGVKTQIVEKILTQRIFFRYS